MATKVHGKNGQVYINGVLVAQMAEWQFSVTREIVDVTVLADTWKNIYAGVPGIEGSFAGLYDNDGSDPVIAAAMVGLCTIALWSSAGQLVASGQGFVDVSVQANVSDAVRCSGTFKGTGAWALA